jgi:hypothetical protein
MYTLQGKIRPTRHVRFPRQSTYVQRTLPVSGPRTWQHFARHRQIWTDLTAPEKKGFWHNPQHASWPIRGSVLQGSDGVERQRPGRGAHGRRRCRAIVNGGWVGAADRWAGTRRGPGRQRLGAVQGSVVRRVGAALTGGAGSTVRPIRFSNWIKFISNGFKFAPNFDR